MRALWPALDATAAPDAVALAWVNWARNIAGENYGDDILDAQANALAHMMYRLDPSGTLGSGGVSTGQVTSIKTLSLSVSYGAAGGGSAVPGSDADLMTTRPGQALLALRATKAAIVLPFVL